MTKRLQYLSLVALLATPFFLFSCGPKEEVLVIDETFATQTENLLIKVDTLHSELENPWGMTWLPDGRLLVT